MPTLTDFTSIITRIKSLNPDMLYVSDTYPAGPRSSGSRCVSSAGFQRSHVAGVVVPGMLAPAEARWTA